VIVLAVPWYLRFALSYRDVEGLLTERGVQVDHTTIYRWVLRFTPLLAEAARPSRHAVGDRWQVDETYVKRQGRGPVALRLPRDRPVRPGHRRVVSRQRDTKAARRFFQRAIGSTKVTPAEVTTDLAAPVARRPANLDERRPGPLLPPPFQRSQADLQRSSELLLGQEFLAHVPLGGRPAEFSLAVAGLVTK
jgi:transposase-like protein